MSRIKVTARIYGIEEVKSQLSETYIFKIMGYRNFDEAFRETVDELFERIVDTSPVDTGRYQDSWTLKKISDKHYQIVNSATNRWGQIYGWFLILGTEKFKNSENMGYWELTDPKSGILHDLQRLLFEWSDFAEKVKMRWR